MNNLSWESFCTRFRGLLIRKPADIVSGVGLEEDICVIDKDNYAS